MNNEIWEALNKFYKIKLTKEEAEENFDIYCNFYDNSDLASEDFDLDIINGVTGFEMSDGMYLVINE